MVFQCAMPENNYDGTGSPYTVEQCERVFMKVFNNEGDLTYDEKKCMIFFLAVALVCVNKNWKPTSMRQDFGGQITAAHVAMGLYLVQMRGNDWVKKRPRGLQVLDEVSGSNTTGRCGIRRRREVVEGVYWSTMEKLENWSDEDNKQRMTETVKKLCGEWYRWRNKENGGRKESETSEGSSTEETSVEDKKKKVMRYRTMGRLSKLLEKAKKVS